MVADILSWQRAFLPWLGHILPWRREFSPLFLASSHIKTDTARFGHFLKQLLKESANKRMAAIANSSKEPKDDDEYTRPSIGTGQNSICKPHALFAKDNGQWNLGGAGLRSASSDSEKCSSLFLAATVVAVAAGSSGNVHIPVTAVSTGAVRLRSFTLCLNVAAARALRSVHTGLGLWYTRTTNG